MKPGRDGKRESANSSITEAAAQKKRRPSMLDRWVVRATDQPLSETAGAGADQEQISPLPLTGTVFAFAGLPAEDVADLANECRMSGAEVLDSFDTGRCTHLLCEGGCEAEQQLAKEHNIKIVTPQQITAAMTSPATSLPPADSHMAIAVTGEETLEDASCLQQEQGYLDEQLSLPDAPRADAPLPVECVLPADYIDACALIDSSFRRPHLHGITLRLPPCGRGW
jgi:hypothetical protein